MYKVLLLMICVLMVVTQVAAIPANSIDSSKSSSQNFSETMAAPAMSPTIIAPDENYRIMEEDVLRLDVWGEQQLSGIQMQVTPDGKINVPYVGSIQAAGLTQAEITKLIVKKLEEAEILANAKVQISLITMHQPTVRVVGEVNRPGSFPFKEGDTILDAIAQAGSYTKNAWLEKATLTRKGSDVSIPIDLYKMFNGDLSQNYKLQNGDNIYIPPEDYHNKIYVLGQVRQPGIYDLKERTTVLSAISLAGGANERGAVGRTIVVRGDLTKPEQIQCDITRVINKGDISQDVVLQAGDIVFVPETKKVNLPVLSQILNIINSLTYVRRYGIF